MKQQVIQFIDNMQIFHRTLGLQRMKSLMNRLGNPQEKLKVVHVAGTNGKGSVCAMLTAILMEAGYTVGLFTSPHLVEYNERIQLQRVPIDDEMFAKIGMIVKSVCEDMVSSGEELPSVFEFLTAMAFLYFEKCKTDIIVLETGIGGTYDATNIVSKPLVSVITSIGKDHMSILGSSIKEITQEKAGIIKKNCPTVLYNSDNTVYNIVNYACKDKKSQLFTTREATVSEIRLSTENTIFSVSSPYFEHTNIQLNLIGEYQVSNALTTFMTVEVLGNLGYSICNKHVYTGLKKVEWAGRMEIIQKNPTIIIDGAHNEQSALAFKNSISSFTQNSKVYILMGVLKDKDYKAILEILLPIAHTIIVTQSNHPRALEAEELCKEINYVQSKLLSSAQTISTQIGRLDNPTTNNVATSSKNNFEPKGVNIILEKDINIAYQKGKAMLDKSDILCCLGSLYLVGELKKNLIK